MDDIEKKDLKKDGENDPEGKKSDPEKNDPKAGKDGLKPDGEGDTETPEQIAARLLRDGTPIDKDIKIPKSRYDELRGVEEFQKAHAPLFEKIRNNPELVDKLFKDEKKVTNEEELTAFLEERKAQKRREIQEAVTEGLTNWGKDFENSFKEVNSIADNLVKTSGVSYKDALRRGFLAIHPEKAQDEQERIARENANREGVFSGSGGQPYQPSHHPDNSNKLTEGEQGAYQIMSALPIFKDVVKSPEEYQKLLEKHKDWLQAKGLNDY